MRKYLWEVCFSIVLGFLCYATLGLSKDDIWETLGVGWVEYLGLVACVLLISTLFTVWGEPKDTDIDNKEKIDTDNKKL